MILLIAVAFVLGLFIDLTGDSGLYAAIARQMVESGNWFNLKINGVPYEQKPHLFFWLAGAGLKLFGNTNFAFKLFPFLWALAGVYFTYQLGKFMFSKETGKWAALIMVTSQITFLYLLDFHTDTVLFTPVTLALWQLAVYLKKRKLIHLVWGFIGVGLAMLAKGPIGAVLPFFAVLYYIFMRKDYRLLFQYKWALGILIVLVIVSPALIHLYENFGWKGIWFYFITNNFGRISGEYAGTNNDVFFYVHTFLWAFLPWTVFVAAGLYAAFNKAFNPFKTDEWSAYLVGSVLVLVVILSMAKGKAPNYFLIAVPPLSVLAGNWLVSQFIKPEKVKRSVLNIQWCLVGLLIVAFVLAMYVNKGNNNWLPLVLILLMFIAAFVVFRWPITQQKQVILLSLLVAGSLNVFLNASVIPHLFSYQGAGQAVKIYEQLRQKNDKLYNFELEEYELLFMANDSVQQIKDWNVLYKVMESSGTWVYTDSIKYNDIIKMDYDIDTVCEIRQRGMNKLNIHFLDPKNRDTLLNNNFLIKTK